MSDLTKLDIGVGPEDAVPHEDWGRLINGQLPVEEAEHLLQRGAEAVDAFLAREELGRETLFALLERRLAGGVDASTWYALDNSLHDFLGPDLAYLLTWMFSDENPTPRLTALDGVVDPSGIEFLRAVCGMFGDELSRALLVGTGAADDWRRLVQEVSLDQLANRYNLRLRIQKFNGEWLFLDGPPTSFLNLTRNLMSMILAVGQKEAFSIDAIDSFSAEMAKLAPFFAEPPEPSPAATLDGAAGEPAEEAQAPATT